jgi:hypothetical protein
MFHSRMYLAAAAVLAPAVFAGQLLGGTPAALAFLAVGLMITVFAFAMSVMAGRLRDLSRRPARFRLTPTGFHARPAMPPAVLVLFCSVAAAGMLGGALARTRSDRQLGLVLSGATVVLLAAAVVAAVFVVGRASVSLTPEGIRWGRWLFRRQVGWDAVAPGGPPRLHPGEGSLRFDTRDGRRSFSGLVDVNPRFLVDAIRWYVAHPEHRAGIGTQHEHGRLVRELQAAA